ncbi:MAG: DsrE family protein [Oscillospiraceae bacterium]|nr:DsrE family protein [Oscillospiraceae bacterium]
MNGTGTGHVHILWTSPEVVTFDKMVKMYAVNSMKKGWWEAVTVIIWGGATKLSAENEEVRAGLCTMRDAGVHLSACVTCAHELGVEDALTAQGIECIPWGPPLTELLRSGAPLLSV